MNAITAMNSPHNLRHWNQHADIDPRFTKPITGKQYKGTSPNPQYVIKCLTDIFGPVGEGFGWDVVAEDFTPMGDEVLHWCRIKFWHSDRANTYDSYGQTKALMKTKNGLMLDEDAPKKSLTDAIIKAASHVGIASNIFLGRWDDQKYVAQVAQEHVQRETSEATDKAKEYLTEADSLEELARRWGGIPKDVQRIPAVIEAKDKRKIALTPKDEPQQSASEMLDDEVPH